MITRHALTFLLFFHIAHFGFFTKSDFTISGYIEDVASGEKLIAANVFDLQSLEGAVSNTYGFFSLTLPADSVKLTASYIGFQTVASHFVLRKDTTITFRLSSSIELAEVEVVAEKLERIEENTQMSRMVSVPIEQIESMPALLGEVDVLKSLQLLPWHTRWRRGPKWCLCPRRQP